MDKIQDMLSPLVEITAILTLIVGFFAAIIKFFEVLKQLRPPLARLLIVATQIVPVVAVIWYFMYWAVQYHNFFAERAVFMLLVAEPSALILIYEYIWGKWLYPKLLPFTIKEVNEEEPTNVSPVENRRQKPSSKSRKIKK